LNEPNPTRRLLHTAVLLAGLVLTQVILYGPSLVGSKILLPLDILALPHVYLPKTHPYGGLVPANRFLSDQVLNYEFSRRFAAAEFRAGRIPLWDPYSYAGAPFAHFGKYSPFSVVYYCFPSPVTLAWLQFLKSLVAGVGAYLFFRAVLKVGFWPAAVGAWCYPLTGFFVLWQGYPLTFVVAWFPYVLLATDRAVRRPGGWGGPALALFTCLTILSGHVDVAGQVLLASGLYGLWCLVAEYGRALASRRAAGAAAAVAGGWALGMVLAAPYFLPLLDYAQTGSRIRLRQAGRAEERPPEGPAAALQTVLPNAFGSMETGSLYLVSNNQLEGAAAAYTGLLAAGLLVPLAWCSRRHRALNWFWLGLAFLTLGWLLDVPGLVQVLRLPGLNLMSHNRFVFATSFAILALAVVGLEVLSQGTPGWRHWFALPLVLLLALAGWCGYRAVRPPEALEGRLEAALREAPDDPTRLDPEGARQVRQTFTRRYIEGAALCALAVLGWAWLASGVRPHRWPGMLLGGLVVGELLWFASGVNPQCDPALYYPPVAALEELARAPAGRVVGVVCLPSNLNQVYRLRDVRGYDGIDPIHTVKLLNSVRDPKAPPPVGYAQTQWYSPALQGGPEGTLKVPAVLSMLNVRYLIFRDPLPAYIKPLLQRDDYWVYENPEVLPRAFVPRQVKPADHPVLLLEELTGRWFDPREVAYVDGDLALSAPCRGTAAVVEEIPSRVTVAAEMETPGLLVLADQWDEGWQAYVDGRPVTVWCVNYGLRGVRLPVGSSRVVFSYEPRGFLWGTYLLLGGGALLGIWAGVLAARKRLAGSPNPSVAPS
jgi:hypothetical protein